METVLPVWLLLMISSSLSPLETTSARVGTEVRQDSDNNRVYLVILFMSVPLV